VRVHSFREPPVAAGGPFPVLVMRGGASGQVSRYTTLAEDLASHGYVVVGVDAPYRTSVVAFPDGRVARRTRENDIESYPDAERASAAIRLLAAWDTDIGFTLDRLEALNRSDPSGRFAGRLDLTRAGVFGHSFGGAQAAQFCHDDRRCRAGVDIDGRLFGSVVREGMDTPFMFLFSGRARTAADADTRAATDADTRQVFDEVRATYDRLPRGSRQWLFIRGANHFMYSDNGVILDGVLARALRLSGLFALDPQRQLAVTAYALRVFFDAHLAPPGTAASTLLSAGYPELEPMNP
ncbi:MAG TPA: hypothetical protein VG871_20225, partial [Vicinamibacterales bacterium]|nr:hypothetical protein [Vicinamibacterales bacterium]